VAPGAELPTASEDGQRLTLRRITFGGNTVVPTAELEALAAPYLARPIGSAELEQLRLQGTRLYVDRGYVNSGLRLRGVSAADATAEFEVVEGRLADIRLHGMERLHDDYVRQQLQRPGDGPLNLDLLRERFQLLLADPLFERLNARLLPGLAPGEAVLDIGVTRARAYELRAFANNHRPVSIGEAQVGLGGWVRNLTGRGDLLEATLQAPVEGGDDVRGSLAWRLPLGRGTQFSVALDHGSSSVIEEAVRGLEIESRLGSIELGLAQTVSETLAHRFSLGVQGVYRENRTWLLGVPFSFAPGEPDGVVRERLGRFWQELVLRSQTQVLALRSTFVWGRNNLQDVPGLPAGPQPPSGYRVWLGQAQYVRQLGAEAPADGGLQFIARATVQRSPDRLLALDGIALGGVATVRGYRENQLVRDEGELLQLELEWPLYHDPARQLRLVAVPFYDHGRGRNQGEPGTTLRSLGVVTRLRWQGLEVDLVLAKRIDPPASLPARGDALQDRSVHLQVAYRY
jgi:hemolysin activation/secretion protein